MANARRSRCFFCNQLVLAKYSSSKPYAIKHFRINSKHGCICSSCIEDFYAKYNNDIKTHEIFSKRSTLTEIIPANVPVSFNPPLQGPTEILANAMRQIEPIHVVVSQAQKVTVKANSNQGNPIKNKFACLDNSLDSYFSLVSSKVFGQDEACKSVLYTIYYNQMANLIEFLDGANLDRRNHILLIGNTGTGKTFMATTIAKVMNIPYAIFNATAITSAGYIGAKVENILETLYRNAGNNLELAENGIIILDEIDKKRTNPDNSGRDVTGRSVQEELLKLLEPSDVYLKELGITFNTRNITVILMGAFVGLDEIINKRVNKKIIGFKPKEDTEKTLEVTQDDLIEYGFIPEFVGRIPAVITLNNLSKDVIIDIIYALISKLNIFFISKNVDLIIDELFIDSLADIIVESSTGARDVYKQFFHIFKPALYRVFQSTGGGVCEIDKNGNTLLIVGDNANAMQTYQFESCINIYEEE